MRIIDNKKFLVPFQGGFDGFAPHRTVLTGQNIVADGGFLAY